MYVNNVCNGNYTVYKSYNNPAKGTRRDLRRRMKQKLSSLLLWKYANGKQQRVNIAQGRKQKPNNG